MNNIEIDELIDLKAGMTDREINEIKNKMRKGKKYSSSNYNSPIFSSPMILNLKRDIPDARDFKLKADVLAIDDNVLLPIIDYTDDMSPVKDQGRLGSCVGFAVAAMKEYQEKIEHEKEVGEGKKYKRSKKDYDLSEAWMY